MQSCAESAWMFTQKNDPFRLPHECTFEQHFPCCTKAQGAQRLDFQVSRSYQNNDNLIPVYSCAHLLWMQNFEAERRGWIPWPVLTNIQVHSSEQNSSSEISRILWLCHKWRQMFHFRTTTPNHYFLFVCPPRPHTWAHLSKSVFKQQRSITAAKHSQSDQFPVDEENLPLAHNGPHIICTVFTTLQLVSFTRTTLWFCAYQTLLSSVLDVQIFCLRLNGGQQTTGEKNHFPFQASTIQIMQGTDLPSQVSRPSVGFLEHGAQLSILFNRFHLLFNHKYKLTPQIEAGTRNSCFYSFWTFYSSCESPASGILAAALCAYESRSRNTSLLLTAGTRWCVEISRPGDHSKMKLIKVGCIVYSQSSKAK